MFAVNRRRVWPGVFMSAASTDPVAQAWAAFIATAEIEPTLRCIGELREATGVPPAARGKLAFDHITKRTLSSATSFRVREALKTLGKQWERRRASEHTHARPLSVLVSGAGPVGLRCALECALLGMCVSVVEKREDFSRVNILTLWQQTADDLAGFAAKLFYPRFTSRGDLLYLGTREMQASRIPFPPSVTTAPFPVYYVVYS
jgi:hypothetical protein|tara:strand:+ start:421 stop:1032 length:612 start_codon:yes stop_codon:yes gene_type:complete